MATERLAPRVTIRDVARAAGVGPSTVSKALNDGRGSADVRRRVEEAAARLGYRPNQRARGLRRSESRSIGVLIPDLANPVFLPLLRGVEQAARERGYVVLIADGQRSDAAETAALERFFDQGVDGLLLGGPVTTESLQLYLDHGVPVAPSLSPADRDRARRRERNEAHATAEMAQHLLDLGHRVVAFVTTPQPKGQQGRRYRRSRLGALATPLEAAGADLRVWMVDPRLGSDASQRELERLARAARPTAAVCANLMVAPWLLLALDAVGMRVPDDVSVVVYGDSDWARAFHPALSVVSRDTYSVGHDLATSLFDSLAGVETPRADASEACYVRRASCAPPPAA
jgi:LacI family transcriptional regulator